MKLSDTTKSLMKGTIILCGFGLVLGVFFAPQPIFYAAGVVLGCFMSLFKLILLEKAVNKSINSQNKARAAAAMRSGYVIRYFLTAAVLAGTAFIMGVSGILGALVGAVALTLSASFVKIFTKKEGGAP